MQVEVADRDGEHQHPCERVEIVGARMPRQHIRHAGKADDAADLLILLVSGRSERLAEVLLVDAGAGRSVEAFDDKGREAIERRDVCVERGELHPAGQARSVLLVEDDGRKL